MDESLDVLPKVITVGIAGLGIAGATRDATAALLAGILVALVWIMKYLHELVTSAADVSPVNPRHTRIIQLIAEAVQELSS